MLMAEMEKLREEVRKLTESSAAKEQKPAATPAAAKAVPVPAETSKPPAGAKAKQPPVPETKTSAPAPVASQPQRLAPAKPAGVSASELALREWVSRTSILEEQRGSLTFTKAVAILLGPYSDEQLLELVKKERALRDLAFHSAFAIGITTEGKIAAWRVWSVRSADDAREFAIERCSTTSTVRCSAVMMDGKFLEAGFLEWAGNARGKSIIRLRNDFLALRVK
jgi:hypothetical protein